MQSSCPKGLVDLIILVFFFGGGGYLFIDTSSEKNVTWMLID